MKQSPQDRRILERMAAGALSRDGFLGSDGRDLGEILQADAAAVARLGVTDGQLAEALDAVLRAAVEALGRPVEVGQDLQALHLEAMGRIACPFGGCGVFHKGQVELTDRRSGRTWLITPLSVHLVARHGFYQGRGSAYRLEPDGLAGLLGRLRTGGRADGAGRPTEG